MLQIEIIEKMSETRRMEGTENIDGKKEKKNNVSPLLGD